MLLQSEILGSPADPMLTYITNSNLNRAECWQQLSEWFVWDFPISERIIFCVCDGISRRYNWISFDFEIFWNIIVHFRSSVRCNDKNVVSVGITRVRCWGSLMPINVQFDTFSMFLFRLLELKISIWQLNSKYYNGFILEGFLNTMIIWIS